MKYGLSCMLLLGCINALIFGQSSTRTTVCILLFDDVQIIDFTGPWETFGQAGYKVFTVAESRDTIHASMGMKVIPDYTFSEAPDADILVVPGGGIPHDLPEDHPIILWLKSKEPQSDIVMTVCNGAFVLGPAGYTNGLSMTTNAGMINHLRDFAEGCTPVYDERFVHDGKFITAGGLTAGIDASLYLISQINSIGRAQEVANKMEYHWDTTGTYVRTKLADFELSRALDFNPPLRKKVLKYEGDEEYWLLDFEVRRPETLEQFSGQLMTYAQEQQWQLISKRISEDSHQYAWSYSNHRGMWSMNAEFNLTESENTYRLKITLNKLG